MTTYPTSYRPEPQHGPVEEGQTLLSLDRNRGTERLRVSLEEFNGFPFVRLQVWAINGQGEWWPVRGKCVTVKLRETGEIAAVLANVAREYQGQGPHDRRQQLPARRQPPQRALPGPTGTSGRPQPPFEPTGRFSEFDDDGQAEGLS